MSLLDALVFAQAKEAGWPKPEREYRFRPSRRWRIDYFWNTGERVALEIEGGVWTGGRHTSGAGFMRDIEKYNAMAVDGIRLLRLTPDQVQNGELVGLLREVLG